MDTFPNPEFLVEPAWLNDHLDDPAVVAVDVTAKLSSKLENHAADAIHGPSHIPGSVFLDVASGKGALSDPTHELPWMWPSVARVEETLGSLGIGTDTRIVLVGRTPRPGIDAGTMWCTRAWWTLHHMGARVAILHGGLERWEAEGRPLTDAPTDRPPTRFVAGGDGLTARATRDDVVAAIADGSGTCVVDALSPADFAGTGNAYGPRPGHITGAINAPGLALIDAETAGFPPPAELRRRLEASGLLDRDRIITYCGGAIAATIPAFALALFDRHHGVQVYDGSLMEWSADPDLPMSTTEA